MKKILCILLISVAFAEVDLQKAVTLSLKVAASQEQQLKYQDSASILSDVWSLNTNYTFEMFRDEQIEWSRAENPQLGDALIIANEDKEILFCLGTASKFFVSFTNFKMVSFSEIPQQKLEKSTIIRANDILKTKIVNVHMHLVSHSFSGKSMKISGELKATHQPPVLQTPVVVFSGIKNKNLNLTLTVDGKKETFFEPVEKGEILRFLDHSKSVIQKTGVEASLPLAKFEHVVIALDLMVINMGQ